MLPIGTEKYCCGGGNAVLIEPLFPMVKRKKKYFMAIFQCKKCKEMSLRGENQEKEWNTFVEIINDQKVQELIQRKKGRKK